MPPVVQAPPPAAPAPPAPATVTADVTAPALVLAQRLAVDSGRKNVSVPITCPVAESSCSGSLTISVAGPKTKGKPTTVTVATGPFATTSAGQTTLTKLKLTKSGRKLLAGRKTRSATLSVAVTDAAGNRATPTAKVTLAVDRAKKKRA